jgi:hypothetical protein
MRSLYWCGLEEIGIVVWLLGVWCRLLRVKWDCGESCAAVCLLEGQLACWSSRRERKAGVRVWPPVLK